MNTNSFWWRAPEYFSRWRLFPRAFITMYIYLLYKTVIWFQELPAPTMEQAGLVSVIVGAGAAWFGLYVNSTSSKFESIKVDTTQTGSMPTTSSSTKVEMTDTSTTDDDEPVIIRRKRNTE